MLALTFMRCLPRQLVVKLDGVQTAVDSLVCGAAQQHLASSWEAHQGFCQAHHIPSILHLPCHMMHL